MVGGELLKCPRHNLPEEVVCVGEYCNKRIGCELCVAKHEHKFYLDNKAKEKNVRRVQQEIQQKLQHLKEYTRVNVKTLKLEAYRQQLEDSLAQERLYLRNKLEEEHVNFQLYMEKVAVKAGEALDRMEQVILAHWADYNREAQRHLEAEHDYDRLMAHFAGGDWTGHAHVEQSVHFLYSEELLFRFNRNLDKLKKEISHHKKENELLLGWLYVRRNDFGKYQLCPHATFEQLLARY
jgi:hypothetical protein